MRIDSALSVRIIEHNVEITTVRAFLIVLAYVEGTKRAWIHIGVELVVNPENLVGHAGGISSRGHPQAGAIPLHADGRSPCIEELPAN